MAHKKQRVCHAHDREARAAMSVDPLILLPELPLGVCMQAWSFDDVGGDVADKARNAGRLLSP